MNDMQIKDLGNAIKQAGSNAKYSGNIGLAITFGVIVWALSGWEPSDINVNCGNKNIGECFKIVSQDLMDAGLIDSTDLKAEASKINWTLNP